MANKAIVVKVNDNGGKQIFSVTEWTNSYEFIRDNVGGLIECIYLPILQKRHIDLWCNDEGKMLDLKPSFGLSCDGKVVDVIADNVVVTKNDGQGNTIGLTGEDVSFLTDLICNHHDNDIFCIWDDGILKCLPYDNKEVK